jgi:uncharacterized membrane protein
MRRSQLRARPAGPAAADVRPSSGGIGRASSAAAERVSDDLRRGTGDFLEQRRRLSALSLAASAAMGVVAAYQTGLVRHLPEPPLALLDADRVDASGEAYVQLRAPDATLGLLSYAATLALVTIGDRDRSRELPLLPLAALAKVGFDAVGGAYLALEQGTKHKRFCSWCLAASAASLAMVPAALPEARAAWRHLRTR